MAPTTKKKPHIDLATPPAEFKLEYYSSAQAQIFFDDILIDELVNIQYTLATNRRPLYGYGSSKFDVMADGNELIQGTFTINYIEANYINIIAQVIIDKRAGLEQQYPMMERVARIAGSIDKLSEPELQAVVNSIRGLSNKEFIDFAVLYKQLIKESGENLLASVTSSFPFDIWLVLGEYSDDAATSTTRVLRDVYLTGQSQVIESSGSPIQEVYSFYAREMT